jgi:DnaJ-class molecular chaperone
MGLTKDASD